MDVELMGSPSSNRNDVGGNRQVEDILAMFDLLSLVLLEVSS